MELLLPSGHIALLDDRDASLLEGRYWFVHRVKTKSGNELLYVHGREGHKGPTTALHKVILGLPHGDRTIVVDHRNNNGLDNRRQNLRACTQKENSRNSGKKKYSKQYKGVYLCKKDGTYYANLSVDRKSHQSRMHKTPESAAVAYDRLARAFHGEFANLNFPEAA